MDEIPASQHERLMKRFEREAKAMAKFSHPNIVPVHDFGEVDGSPYLVMEYIPGGTLKERITKPIPWEQAVRWLAPVADALRYAHGQKVIHRDVKPNNILFDSEGRPLLTDFGIAKVLETEEATLTGTGLGVGTPEYMAPEQWRGKASEATDQYALGVVLYELLTGQKPYTADTPAAVAIMQATEPLPRPSKLVKGIPEEVEKVLYKVLARDPQDRYEDMEALRKALQGFFVRGSEALLQKSNKSNGAIADKNQGQKPPRKPTLSASEIEHTFLKSDPVNPKSTSPVIENQASESVTWDEMDLSPEEINNNEAKGVNPAKSENRKNNTEVQKKKKWVPIILIVCAIIVVSICIVVYFMPASWWCELTGDAIGGCEVNNIVDNDSGIETPEISIIESNLGTVENPLIWALVPIYETNAALSGFQGVANYLYDETGLVIEPFLATDYAGVIEALSADPPKTHISSLPSFAYLIASAHGDAEVAMVAERYGSTSYNGQIFVRADSDITSIEDLNGMTFCRPDKLSTSGWIIPMITLRAFGIDPDTDLAEVVEAGSHEDAVVSVYNGDCDAGSSYVDARSNLSEDYPDIMEAITVIMVSVDIPNDGLQFSPVVPQELQDKIIEALLLIDQNEEALAAMDKAFEWTKLVVKKDSFFEPFRQILDAAGITPEQIFNGQY